MVSREEGLAENVVASVEKNALLNALRHDGRAEVGAVMSKVIGEYPELRASAKEVARAVEERVKEVNAMTVENLRALLRESILLFQDLGDRVGVAETLEHFSVLAVEEGMHAPALRMAGAASALRDQVGGPATPTDRTSLEHHLSKARAALGDVPAHARFGEGARMTLVDAVALATQDRGIEKSRARS